MNYKYFFCIAFYFFACLAENNPFADQISGGRFSEDEEQEIKELLCEINKCQMYKEKQLEERLALIDMPKVLKINILSKVYNLPEIRKISAGLVEHMPNFKNGGFYEKYNYLYLDSDKFNKLTADEKKFWLADVIYGQKFVSDKVIRADKFLIGIFSILAVPSIILWKKIYKKDKFLGAVYAIYPIVFCIGPLALIINKIQGISIAQRLRLNTDVLITSNYKCREGAISLFQKYISDGKDFNLSDDDIKFAKKRLLQLK